MKSPFLDVREDASALLLKEMEPLRRFFRAMAAPARVNIVSLLSLGTMTMPQLERCLRVGNGALLNALRRLEGAGVVIGVRRGRFRHYRLVLQKDVVLAQALERIATAALASSELSLLKHRADVQLPPVPKRTRLKPVSVSELSERMSPRLARLVAKSREGDFWRRKPRRPG